MIPTQRGIAIHAKDAESCGITLSFKPPIEATSSRELLAKAAPMLCSSTINVVYGQKLDMVLATAGATSTPIGFKGLDFDFSTVVSEIFCRMIIPLTVIVKTLFFMGLVVGSVILEHPFSISRSPFFVVYAFLFSNLSVHNNTVSFQLAALTRQAGQRQLVLSIPQV